jgi:serralysin
MDSLSQSNYVDALLWPGAKWPSNTITYSFMPSIPEIYKAAATGLAATVGVPVAWAILGTGVVEQATFTPFNNIQRGATQKALNLWAEVADIQFEQKVDKALQLADILDLGVIESFLKGISKWDEFADALDDYIGNFIGFPVVEGSNIRFGSISNPNSNSPGLGIPPLLTDALAVDQIRQTIADWIDNFIEPLDEHDVVPSAINLLKLTSIKPYPFGDIWLNSNHESVSSSDISNWSEGGEGFETLLHEIGHTLGLKHPGNYDAGGFISPSPFLPKAQDSVQYTIMSYDYRDADPNIQRVRTANPLTPMLYDIAAIQQLYGANFSTRSDDTTYFWNDPDSPFWKDPTKPFMMTIWDGGGNDTISAANQSLDSLINLNAGQFSSIGHLNKTYFFDIEKKAYLRDSTGKKLEDPQEKYNLAIAFGVTIESAVGGIGNDTIIGNDVNNILQGGDGDDSLEGRGGSDDLQGEDGNDTINSGTGYDTVDGGSGIDKLVVDYSTATSGMNWGLYDYYGRSSGYVYNSGVGQVVYYNIEQFQITGGAYDDQLYGAALNDSLSSGAGNDTIDAGAGNDTLNGGAGNDTLIGGAGTDQLTGGAGADRFYFYTRTQGIDTITDFNVVDDAIYISSSFGGGLMAGAAITTAQFTLGSSASDSSDRFIYNQNTGALFFDIDGTGSSRQNQIAQLSTGLAMTNQNIVVFA